MEASFAEAGKGQADQAEHLGASEPRRRVLPLEHAAQLLAVVSSMEAVARVHVGVGVGLPPVLVQPRVPGRPADAGVAGVRGGAPNVERDDARNQGGVEAHGDVLGGLAPDEGQEEDVEGEAQRGEDGYRHHLQRVVRQLPAVLPHCLRPVSSPRGRGGRRWRRQCLPRATEGPRAGPSRLAFPLPEGRRALRSSAQEAGPERPGSDEKGLVFATCLLVFGPGKGVERGFGWPTSDNGAIMEREERGGD